MVSNVNIHPDYKVWTSLDYSWCCCKNDDEDWEDGDDDHAAGDDAGDDQTQGSGTNHQADIALLTLSQDVQLSK